MKVYKCACGHVVKSAFAEWDLLMTTGECPRCGASIDNTDAVARAVHGGASGTARNFDALATRRTPVTYLIAARLALVPVTLLAATGSSVNESLAALQILVYIVLLGLSIVSVVVASPLCRALDRPGWHAGVTFFGWIGLIMLWRISAQATDELRTAGYQVGLFSAHR